MPEHLHKLNDSFGALFAVETFDESDRVLSPFEVCSHGLPMVVDLAHVESLELTRLVGCYGDHIRTFHTWIGWRQIGGQPLIAGLVAPDSYPELAVLSQLAGKRWKGNTRVEHDVDRFPTLVEALRFLAREVTGSVRTSTDTENVQLRASFVELAGHMRIRSRGRSMPRGSSIARDR